MLIQASPCGWACKTHLGGGIHSELQFALLAVVDREPLHQQGSEAWSSAAAERVEHEEALRNTRDHQRDKERRTRVANIGTQVMYVLQTIKLCILYALLPRKILSLSLSLSLSLNILSSSMLPQFN